MSPDVPHDFAIMMNRICQKSSPGHDSLVVECALLSSFVTPSFVFFIHDRKDGSLITPETAWPFPIIKCRQPTQMVYNGKFMKGFSVKIMSVLHLPVSESQRSAVTFNFDLQTYDDDFWFYNRFELGCQCSQLPKSRQSLVMSCRAIFRPSYLLVAIYLQTADDISQQVYRD